MSTTKDAPTKEEKDSASQPNFIKQNFIKKTVCFGRFTNDEFVVHITPKDLNYPIPQFSPVLKNSNCNYQSRKKFHSPDTKDPSKTPKKLTRKDGTVFSLVSGITFNREDEGEGKNVNRGVKRRLFNDDNKIPSSNNTPPKQLFSLNFYKKIRPEEASDTSLEPYFIDNKKRKLNGSNPNKTKANFTTPTKKMTYKIKVQEKSRRRQMQTRKEAMHNFSASEYCDANLTEELLKKWVKGQVKRYLEKRKTEWSHIQGLWHGGKNHKRNLNGSTRDSNSHQFCFEKIAKLLHSISDDVTFKVTHYRLPSQQKGQYLYIAETVKVKVTVKRPHGTSLSISETFSGSLLDSPNIMVPGLTMFLLESLMEQTEEEKHMDSERVCKRARI